jgi:hypothetical protein
LSAVKLLSTRSPSLGTLKALLKVEDGEGGETAQYAQPLARHVGATEVEVLEARQVAQRQHFLVATAIQLSRSSVVSVISLFKSSTHSPTSTMSPSSSYSAEKRSVVSVVRP